MKKLLLILPALLLILTHRPAHAGSATWTLNPGSGDWNTAANWTPATVPNSSTDSAEFGFSSTTNVVISSSVEVDVIIFDPAANAYSITASPDTALTLDGVISNSSGIAQTFVAKADANGGGLFQILGTGGGSGELTTFILEGGRGNGSQGGGVSIVGGSAMSSTFLNGGGTVSGALGGAVSFFDVAVLDKATTKSDGGQVSGAAGALTTFYASEDAENGTIIANGGLESGAGSAITLFMGNSRAGAATLIANGGSSGGAGGLIEFHSKSAGGTARVEVFGNGNLDIGSHSGGVTIGSLEGDGLVFLGGQALSVGSGVLSTTFSGVIQDGGISGKTGGALVKIGTNTLTLSNGSIYTGGTTVSAGTLVVSNRSGSATGTGAVQVNAGTLGGSGIISGAVTVSGGAFLAPAHGIKTQSTLTIQSPLTFNAGSNYTYTFKAKGKKARTDKVIANGVTTSGATLAFQGTAQGTLKQGLVLTAISNTAATPIIGTFSNLADGAILTVSGNNFQANYEAGDGNDLTLTVVP